MENTSYSIPQRSVKNSAYICSKCFFGWLVLGEGREVSLSRQILRLINAFELEFEKRAAFEKKKWVQGRMPHVLAKKTMYKASSTDLKGAL